MIDPIQLILQQAGIKSNYFATTSRYYGLETNSLEMENGETAVYVRRRFIAQPEKFQMLEEHVVNENERLDNITHKYLADPQQFWRVCDANAAMDPNELTDTIGRKLRITLPEGIPGIKNA